MPRKCPPGRLKQCLLFFVYFMLVCLDPHMVELLAAAVASSRNSATEFRAGSTAPRPTRVRRRGGSLGHHTPCGGPGGWQLTNCPVQGWSAAAGGAGKGSSAFAGEHGAGLEHCAACRVLAQLFCDRDALCSAVHMPWRHLPRSRARSLTLEPNWIAITVVLLRAYEMRWPTVLLCYDSTTSHW